MIEAAYASRGGAGGDGEEGGGTGGGGEVVPTDDTWYSRRSSFDYEFSCHRERFSKREY